MIFIKNTNNVTVIGTYFIVLVIAYYSYWHPMPMTIKLNFKMNTLIGTLYTNV